MSSLDFVAVDFETANGRLDSVCQVGLARVRGGAVEAVEDWLVLPPTGLEDFEPGNVRIHGITPERLLAGSPLSWHESAARMAEFSGGLPYVAHNASFDRRVWEASCSSCGIPVRETRWLDTVGLSRRHLRLPNHKLGTVVAHLGIKGHAHHDAGSDAAVTAEAVLRIAERAGLATVDELWPPARPRSSSRWSGRGYSATTAELPQPRPDADPAHLLYGQRVVVTGDVPGLSRWEAFEAIAACGGHVEKGVTKRTTVLVVAGRARIGEEYNPALGSAKERKAAQYRDAGQRILLLGAEDFRAIALGGRRRGPSAV